MSHYDIQPVPDGNCPVCGADDRLPGHTVCQGCLLDADEAWESECFGDHEPEASDFMVTDWDALASKLVDHWREKRACYKF